MYLAWRYRHFAPGAQPVRMVRAGGVRLELLRSVFDPAVHFTSGFFATYLGKPGVLRAGSYVLDMGTGSGILAIAAARAGARRVVAVDFNEAAVLCAAGNAARHNLTHRIEVRGGDLFGATQGERFDAIVCNPPYFRGEPQTVAEYAYMGGQQFDWLRRFGIEAHDHLAQGGRLLMVLGDATDVPTILALLAECGWSVREVARRDILVEVLSVYALTPRAGRHCTTGDHPAWRYTASHLD